MHDYRCRRYLPVRRVVVGEGMQWGDNKNCILKPGGRLIILDFGIELNGGDDYNATTFGQWTGHPGRSGSFKQEAISRSSNFSADVGEDEKGD